MKKIFLWGLLLFSCLAWGQEPTESEIRIAASNYLHIFSDRPTLTISKFYPNAIENEQTRYQTGNLMNVIEFQEGGWILLSNDYRIQPVLAYSEKGTWNPDTNSMPPGLVGLLSYFMSQVDTVRKQVTPKSADEATFYDENRQKWTDLQSRNSSYLQKLKGAKSESVENLLCDQWGNELLWRQGYPYDKFTPPGDESSFGCFGITGDNCDDNGNDTIDDGENKPLGCGAVAMGQILWYWKFPPQYDWDMMPTDLRTTPSFLEINNVAHFLKTCGDKACMHYCCSGSWTTTNKIQEALKGMHFPSTEKERRGDRDEGAWWPDLIKGQLREGRPVLYRGDKCDLCSMKHFWVVSGFNSDNLFYCNWGWGNDEVNGYYALNDLIFTFGEDRHNYQKNNMILYDIVPNWDVTSQCTLSYISKGNDEELRHFCGTATLDNITLSGNSQSKIAFTQELIINGPLSVSDDATLTLACYDKEYAAQKQASKSGEKEPYIGPETKALYGEAPPSYGYSDFFSLTPNPTRGDVYISIHDYGFMDMKKDVSVFDSRGELRLQTQFSGSGFNLPLSHLASGMYFIRVSTREIMSTQKLIIQ